MLLPFPVELARGVPISNTKTRAITEILLVQHIHGAAMDKSLWVLPSPQTALALIARVTSINPASIGVLHVQARTSVALGTIYMALLIQTQGRAKLARAGSLEVQAATTVTQLVSIGNPVPAGITDTDNPPRLRDRAQGLHRVRLINAALVQQLALDIANGVRMVNGKLALTTILPAKHARRPQARAIPSSAQCAVKVLVLLVHLGMMILPGISTAIQTQYAVGKQFTIQDVEIQNTVPIMNLTLNELGRPVLALGYRPGWLIMIGDPAAGVRSLITVCQVTGLGCQMTMSTTPVQSPPLA